MNKSLENGVGHILALFLFSVQCTSSTSLHLKTELIPFVRNAGVGCKLPPLPNGRYVTLRGANLKPGQTVAPGTFMDIKCDFGYRVSKLLALCLSTNTWSDQWQCLSNARQADTRFKLPPNGRYSTLWRANLKPGGSWNLHPYKVRLWLQSIRTFRLLPANKHLVQSVAMFKSPVN